MRLTIVPLVVTTALATTAAQAETSSTELTSTAESDDLGDQGIAADVGIAGGGRVTAGGLRVQGHYLYQLSDQDWFDGVAAFTFGNRGAGCAPDQMNTLVCDHGFTSGNSVEIAATVRRMFAARGAFRPFARAGVGVAIVRFGADDVAGVAVPIHVGGGVRARVAPSVAVVTQAELAFGVGAFGHGLGAEPQLGMTVTAGAEFRLR